MALPVRLRPTIWRLAMMLAVAGGASLSATQPVRAQGTDAAGTAAESAPVMLVADSLELDGRERLIAQGNVEAMSGATKLTATRIIYDRPNDQLTLEGPITLIEDGRIVVLADAGEMDSELQNGLLRGARMVMDQQVQMAATRIDRIGGRYTQLYNTSATSCRICNDGGAPLWQIRAKRVIHDQLEQQLYFENAQVRILDVPVLWLPRLRLPDPTLDRATGFLFAQIRQTSQLGFGVKLPYFIALNESRDLTVTPYLSPRTRTLELRYRQAFRRGSIELNGAFSQDDLGQDSQRAYLFGTGSFALARGFQLNFDVEMVSDDTYLLEYDYSEKERLDSAVAITRTQRDQYIRGGLTGYQTLRNAESNRTLPTIIGDVAFEQRFVPGFLGGELRFGIEANARYRSSDDPIGGIGRDVGRLSANAFWLRDWTLAYGLLADVRAGFSVDGFRTLQDDTFEGDLAELVPQAAATLRWPLLRTSANGATQLLEPVAMVGWTGGSRRNLPNDESTRVEFDEGNLLTLSRFPAPDRRERGLTSAYGLNWSRQGPDGYQTNLLLGQVWRDEADNDFSWTSGLSGKSSDVLAAGQIKTPGGLSFSARTLFDGFSDVSKAEARMMLQRQDYYIGGSYVWLGTDPDEDRIATQSEWTLDGSYRFARNWTGAANVRYDIARDKTSAAGIGLRYENECVALNLSLSRRFTASAILEPSTDIGFTVAIRGFGVGGADQRYTRTCRN